MLGWFSRSHMFGLAEWEDETRQNEARPSSTVEAADHKDYYFVWLDEMRDMKADRSLE